MSDPGLRDLYQDIILDHSRHPRHFGPMADPSHHAQGHNPLCGDRVTIYLKVDAEDRIQDVSFEGRGCAISVASASMMTDMLKGRTVTEAKKLMGGFLHLVKGEDASELGPDDREQMEVMAGVSAFPMRVKCATLAWHAMNAALDGKDTSASE